MHIDKQDIVATLRSRGLNDRADWVDRTLPPMVDVHKNSALLQTLDIDPSAMATADADAATQR
jgi:hypothetical protein